MGEILGAIIVFGFAMLMIIALASKLRVSSLNKGYFQTRWKEIQALVKTPEGQRLAVIDADKLVDDALKKLRFSGKTMGERLVSAQRRFSSADSLWSAHKLRNRLVHETDVRVTKAQTKTALKAFAQALKDLGAL